MLVLARKKDEAIVIGDDIEIIITEISEDKVKIGINAPKHLKIFRKELLDQVKEENLQSAGAKVDLEALTKALKR
ncbi:MAG: carbon storage regulator CsrA [Lutispora sp.]